MRKDWEHVLISCPPGSETLATALMVPDFPEVCDGTFGFWKVNMSIKNEKRKSYYRCPYFWPNNPAVYCLLELTIYTDTVFSLLATACVSHRKQKSRFQMPVIRLSPTSIHLYRLKTFFNHVYCKWRTVYGDNCRINGIVYHALTKLEWNFEFL